MIALLYEEVMGMGSIILGGDFLGK